jgi:signal transduction histidine kinase
LATGEIQHLKAIDQNTRFVFQAVSGDLIPGAIITIPIVASGDVLAMISMASLNGYDDQSLKFVQKVHNTLNARVAGILSFKHMTDFSHKLERQNHELETQKTELFQQAAELGRQNAELEMQKRQLDEANRQKTIFLSNMSHELRTPLNSVIALSGVLNRRLANKISDEENNFIKVIERNGKLLLSLINDILDISRIEAGREEVELSQFNVCDQVNDVVNTIQPQASEKNITLTNASGDCELKIISDVKKFHHILQNLIGNAVKFTETGGVTITVKKLSDTIQVSVTDTGIGIDAAHLPHIFDEFRQADGSTSRKFGGTGLGLAIAKKYAALLGGTITVESTPGIGSVFTLLLPVSFFKPDSAPQMPTNAVSRFSNTRQPRNNRKNQFHQNNSPCRRQRTGHHSNERYTGRGRI